MEAGSFSSALEATSKFVSVISSEVPAAQINYFRGKNNRSRGRGNGQRNNRGNGRGNGRGYHNHRNNRNNSGNYNYGNGNRSDYRDQNRNSHSVRTFSSEQGNPDAHRGGESAMNLNQH